MPLQPPVSTFYRRADRLALWYVLSQAFEKYVGAVENRERKLEFERVLDDIRLLISAYPCHDCTTHLVNVAPDSGLKLKCPKCGWEPIKTTQGRAVSVN